MMYQYFLGGFGNRSFIRPQYEIMEDGSLREVVDRFVEFPNGGTVSLAYISDEDVNDIKNRLLKFKIDFNKDYHPTYSSYSENSNQYRISIKSIEEFDRDEIIVLIDIDCSIEEFLNVKTKRTVYCKIKLVLPHLLVFNQQYNTSA